jgi:lipoprotein NlpD
MTSSSFRIVAAVVAACVVAGCATRRPAPIENRITERTPSPVAVAPATAAPPAATSVGPAPVATYVVKRGDTLHQIALDTGLDYRELAAWNNIENVNVIRVGQVLRLAAPGEPAVNALAQESTSGVTTAPLRAAAPIVESRPGVAAAVPPAVVAPAPAAANPMPSPATAAANAMHKTSPKAIKQPYSDQAVRELTLAASAVPAPTEPLAMAAPPGVRAEPKSESRPAAAPAPPAASPPAAPAPAAGAEGDLDWAWPAKGRIITGFSETANLKGIDIAGTPGQAVHASAPGRVVYAGTGLRGYGKLIIIKHNATFLSAYAHNREILVKEGQQVTRGQKIAEMGDTDSDQVKLHFEIRRQGKPIDPTKYLPPA